LVELLLGPTEGKWNDSLDYRAYFILTGELLSFMSPLDYSFIESAISENDELG
jgi:hypothetical protein